MRVDLNFTPINLYQSKGHGHSRLLTEKSCRPLKSSTRLVKSRGNPLKIAARGGEFLSKDDLRQRAKVGQTGY